MMLLMSSVTSSGVASAVHAPCVPIEPSDSPKRTRVGRCSSGNCFHRSTTASMVALFWLIVVWESMMNPIHEGTAEY